MRNKKNIAVRLTVLAAAVFGATLAHAASTVTPGVFKVGMEITYPPRVRQRSDFRGYMFRLALEWTTNEADRLNNVFTSELTQESGVLLANKHIQPLQLIVPLSMSDERDDV